MSSYMLLQDKRRCIGCLACTVACKVNKGLDPYPNPVDVINLGPILEDGIPKGVSVFMPCFHCEEPWCVYACPTGAMKKRGNDGIVFVEQSLCIGCKSCIYACPWGAPQFDTKKGKVVKCDYCMERIDQGLKPACVTICISHCLKFGKATEVQDPRRSRYAMESTAFPRG